MSTTQWPRTHYSYSQKKAKPSSSGSDIKALPNDVIARIGASFTPPDLIGASLVCVAWRDALKPLREAMVLVEAGRILKREGAAYGSTMAMVEAGLIYSLIGRKDEGVLLFRRAAELGDPAGAHNLAIFNLEAANPPNTKTAIEYLYKASTGGNARAQYQLALCFHHGRGVRQCLSEATSAFLSPSSQTTTVATSAAQWYLRAAEGGYKRAMLNTSLLCRKGQGFPRDAQLARSWFRRALNYVRRKHSRDLDEQIRSIRKLLQRNRQGRCYEH
ncbi:hypothetical protein ACJIZ3_018076 [Penstemon smallii]|uniref:F-box domain-containing protein n=1 Tax=Penstemon smallii TaxID=265156 RepID=A0ABD3SXC5_9LAMI